MVHVLSAQQNAPTIAPSINCSKPAQLLRPELQEEATEQDWAHWKVNWERYKRSCLIWKQVGKNVVTEQELLQLMKRMGVQEAECPIEQGCVLGHVSRCRITSEAEEVRKQSCPAFDKECFTCKKKGHFKQACKSKKKGAPEVKNGRS